MRGLTSPHLQLCLAPIVPPPARPAKSTGLFNPVSPNRGPTGRMDSLMRFALVLHLVIETTASINFFLRPSATLTAPQPHSHGVIRQYALLLLTTNIIVAIVLNRAVHDALSEQIAAALALYHAGPFVRAVSRIRQGNSGDVLGGAWLHAFSHLLCFACLVASSFPF